MAAAAIQEPYIPIPTWKCLTRNYCIPQPAVFLTDRCIAAYGLFDLNLHYCMDYEYWCRLLMSDSLPSIIGETTSFFRLHQNSKTSASQISFETET